MKRKVFGTGEVQVCICAWGGSERAPSVHVTQVADWLILHDAQVVHGTAVGNLDCLANAGCASLHHFDLVYGLVHPQRNHFGSRKPLPEGGKTAPMLHQQNVFTAEFPSCGSSISLVSIPLKRVKINILKCKCRFFSFQAKRHFPSRGEILNAS